MRHVIIAVFIVLIGLASVVSGQNRRILIPKGVEGTPFKYDDQEDLFGQAYHWFHEGITDSGSTVLRRLIDKAGYSLDPKAYYVVVAHFTDKFAPIGLFHEDTDFFNTRMYGLEEDNLYYIFISRTPQAPSFLSVLATAKDSPFLEGLVPFLGLFGILSQEVEELSGQETWIDVRQFTVAKDFRKFSDLSFKVKKDLSEEEFLASVVFDNTAKEHWSYGIAIGITSVRDLDLVVGSDGRIIVQPKPDADLSLFGVVNYHIWAVDTKAKTFGNSIHLLGGLRLATTLEPLLGVGGGVSLGFIDLHAFVGYSVEFANELKEGFEVGQELKEGEDPFKTKIRGKPRFGLEIKFP